MRRPARHTIEARVLAWGRTQPVGAGAEATAVLASSGWLEDPDFVHECTVESDNGATTTVKWDAVHDFIVRHDTPHPPAKGLGALRKALNLALP